MISMEQNFEQIDLGGRAPFAKGGTGECYRLDQETILKLYYEGFSIDRIIMEKVGARIALIAGVPTAISFRMAQVGKRYGVMYEFVEGKTFSETIAQAPERAEELGAMLARIAAKLHHAEVTRDDIPKATDRIRQAIPKIDYAPQETVQHIIHFLDALDREKHYIHGDYHPNNVIMTKEGPFLIDMGGFSVGSPFFDLATLHFSLFDSPEAIKGGRSAFNGLTWEESLSIWRGFVREYFAGEMDPASSELLNIVILLKKLAFERLYGMHFSEEFCASIREDVVITFRNEESIV